MRLIDADALLIAVEKDFEGVCVYDVPPSEAVSDFERIVDQMPTIAGLPNFDLRVNAVFDRAISGRDLRFRETDEMCPRCQRDLEVYYCENHTYIVRCKHCHIITIVSAKNPDEAAAKVGLHVKLVRYGRWLEANPLFKGIYQCSACGNYVTMSNGSLVDGRKDYYCCHCGAEMDLEVQDD